MHLLGLPTDIILHVASYLDVASTIALMLTHSRFGYFSPPLLSGYARSAEYCATALYYAIANGNEPVIRDLLANGAPVTISHHLPIAPSTDASVATPNPCTPSPEEPRMYTPGRTPGEISAATESLLQQGSSSIVKFGRGRTPLHRAAGYGYEMRVRSLVAMGIDKHVRDNARMQAINLATIYGHTNIARFLSGES